MTPPKSPQYSGLFYQATYPSMVSALSLAEKQKLLYSAAQGLEGGREALESWTRKDLLQLICHEMGKERKYTGVSKSKMVEQLLKLVAMKGLGETATNSGFTSPAPPTTPQSPCRRQRKAGRPARVPSAVPTPVDSNNRRPEPLLLCKNTACRAQLLPGATFCQRCSCCICKNFDDNKDPSLWIVCTPEPLDVELDCRLSCHIECALKNQLAGVVFDGPNIVLDGSYQCQSCGKISSLIECWRKQLVIARDARRVDTLCQRLSLSHRLLSGSIKHKALHEPIDKAIQKLEDEVGCITEGSAKFARGLVNRLSSSGEVLQLIGSALENAEGLIEDQVVKPQPTVMKKEEASELVCTIEFKKTSSTSIFLCVRGGGEHVTGYRLWHRKAIEADFPNNPTCIISGSPGEVSISGLEPCTEYVFYIVPFFDRGIGEPAEARCFTKKLETESLPSDLNQVSEDWEDPQADEEVFIPDKFESNFKVRELGKVLNSAWAERYQPALDGILNSKAGFNSSDDEKRCGETKSETVNAEKILVRDLNMSAHVDIGMDESRITLSVEPSPLPIRTFLPQDEPKCAVLTEPDDTSDPGNSHTSQREETEVVSQAVSDTPQVNTANEPQDISEDTQRTGDLESHGHGESWAVQVRNPDTAAGMDSQTKLLAKRSTDDFNQGMVTTCGSGGGSLCAARNYEFCVKIIRWLECEGHLKEDFRMKFLTWYSLRASEHEKRVVRVFIDTLQENPASLASQLVDTFSDVISVKRHQTNGFCNKQWH